MNSNIVQFPADAAQPQPFDFNGQQVRVIQIDGEPWFVLADACKVLGLTNPSMAAEGIDADALSTAEVIDSMGRPQSARITDESGLYALAFKSRKPEARDFTRWVTKTVLPAIRRDGFYGQAAPVTELSLSEMTIKVLEGHQQVIEEQRQQIKQLKPEAEVGRRFLNAKPNGRIVREVAKTLGMKEKELRAFLLEEKLIFPRQALCGSVQYDFKAANREHFEAREVVVHHSFGECQHYTIYITPRGVDLIHKRIEDNRRAALEAGANA